MDEDKIGIIDMTGLRSRLQALYDGKTLKMTHLTYRVLYFTMNPQRNTFIVKNSDGSDNNCIDPASFILWGHGDGWEEIVSMEEEEKKIRIEHLKEEIKNLEESLTVDSPFSVR